MNDDFVKCAGEALCMQYALVNTDSLIGVLDIDKIQTLMEDVYSHVADYLRKCDEDEYNTFLKILTNISKIMMFMDFLPVILDLADVRDDLLLKVLLRR